ncbi:hypothetical protein RUM43_005932 [Polyplax serrata]|uniref:Uncharacterized protein n=1 Tax=Polyplax serrata TaxID=468196 RepID=A0AAN8P0N5_POLSC
MSIYFEKKISTTFGDVCTHMTWYKDVKLAIAALSQEKEGYISLYRHTEGNVATTNLRNSKAVSCLAWHPSGTLFAAWDAGPFCCWSDETNEISSIESPHQSTINLLKFSPKGNRLISVDTEGGLVGWNSSGKQLLTAFHHQLSNPVTHVIYRNPLTTGLLDLHGAAKAAVAGDPRALDLFTNLEMFTTWRPKTESGKDNIIHSIHSDSQSFYAASSSGALFYISENGRCQEVFDLGCSCRDILYRVDKDQLIVLTENMAVVQFTVSPEGGLEELMKVKLSKGNHEVTSSILWMKTGIVAVNTGSSSIHVWNLDTGDNSALNLPASSNHVEHFRLLCGGTNAGNLFMWRNVDDDWDIENSIPTSAPVKELLWGNELLVVNTLAGLYILKQQPLAAKHKQNVTAVQISGNNIVLVVGDDNKVTNINCDMQIHGVAVSSKYCVMWSDKSVISHSFTVNLTDVTTQVAGTFNCKCEDIAIYEESLITMERERVTLRTVQGTVKQTLFLMATEGNPIVLGLCSNFITVVTTNGFLKVWDISRREAKLLGPAKNLNDMIDDFGEAISATSNSKGTKVALMIALQSLIPDTKLYVIDLESDVVKWIDFTNGQTHIHEENIITQNISNKIISSFEWDAEDPKLIVCHAKSTPFSTQETPTKESSAVLLWSSNEKGLLVHEVIPLNSRQAKLLSCSAPHIVFLSTNKSDVIDRVTMGDFSGVECNSDSTKEAILNFSYNLAVGNMDMAFKAVNSISSESVWTNLAKNCVKSKRLDVAAVCMGRVKNGRIAKALREAAREPEPEARVAIFAVHVGMFEEAEELLKSCKRYDLLNKFYQATSEWEKAIKVAEVHDRVHLRNTHHLYAKSLEQNGYIDEALENYMKADTHRIYAPRLLMDDFPKLKSYVDQSLDPVLCKWIAQYMESQGDMDTALNYYKAAKDHLSIVRVLCFLNSFQEANEIVENSGDRAAAYHLARKLEAMDRIEEALTFFTRAQTYGNAIRLCKENGLVDKIWSVALPASAANKNDAARFLQEQGETEKAILLYHKAGMIEKALDLAFSSGNTGVLTRMSSDLSADTDPFLLQRVSDFFISNYQYDRAVDVLATAGKFSEAINLCSEHSVPLTDELVNRLNPTGPDRNKLLMEIGECALAQGNYHLATKKFTQAGNKVRAMKALLKSGDTEKIIFLAGVSREKEVYVMAANYLQALDWRSQPQLLNTVIQFYSKAKAYSALSNFYVACANVEVEEYQDFEKAVVALNEAKRCLNKSPEDLSTKKALDAIESKLLILHKYLKAKKAFDNGLRDDAMEQSKQLLGELRRNSTIVRVGDVYALMLKYADDVIQGRELFEAMKKDVDDPTEFLQPEILQSFGYQKPVPVTEQLDDDIGYEFK